MGSRRERNGTTLFEILIAVSFLTLCAYTILETVLTADVQSAYGMRRSVVVSALQDQIDQARGMAAQGLLSSASAATSVTHLTFSGFVGPVTITRTVSLETNSRTLFDVTVTASWTESSSLRTYTDSATMATIVRQS